MGVLLYPEVQLTVLATFPFQTTQDSGLSPVPPSLYHSLFVDVRFFEVDVLIPYAFRSGSRILCTLFTAFVSGLVVDWPSPYQPVSAAHPPGRVVRCSPPPSPAPTTPHSWLLVWFTYMYMLVGCDHHWQLHMSDISCQSSTTVILHSLSLHGLLPSWLGGLAGVYIAMEVLCGFFHRLGRGMVGIMLTLHISSISFITILSFTNHLFFLFLLLPYSMV